MAERVAAMVLLCLGTLAWGQGAIDAFEFDSVAESQRYQSLIDEFRCPKCLNTNLSGSDAPIAADLRRVVYGLVREGRSDTEIRAFLQARYGDFVLYDPPVRADTIALWLIPLVLAGVAGLIVVLLVRRRRGTRTTLDSAAQARLAALLSDDSQR